MPYVKKNLKNNKLVKCDPLVLFLYFILLLSHDLPATLLPHGTHIWTASPVE